MKWTGDVESWEAERRWECRLKGARLSATATSHVGSSSPAGEVCRIAHTMRSSGTSAAIATGGQCPTHAKNCRSLTRLRQCYIYLISNPFALSADDTFSIAACASASVSVFSKDWKMRRKAKDFFPCFSNVSKNITWIHRFPASFQIKSANSVLDILIPCGIHIAMSLTMYG